MLQLKYKIGTCKFYSSRSKKWEKADVYTCNALIACVDKDFNLVAFFGDLEHLKRCLGLRNGYDNCLIGWLDDFELKGGIKTTYGTRIETIVSNLNRSGIKAITY
ncbi:MAG: hypothetical protein ACI35W_05480 [Anaeroplasmataceae bacterium]